MMTRIVLLLAFLGVASSSLAVTPTAKCTARCAYRTGTTCTAPAFVNVDCIGDGTTETVSNDATVRPFHDLMYEIDYGDATCSSGQGAWANSDSNASKNVDYSPIGAHVYECAGLKTITTTVRAPDGSISQWTGTITIESEDAGWPGAATKCVACGTTPIAGSAGCPASATVQNSCDFDAALQLSAGTRTLYKCGDSFVMDTNPVTANAVSNASLVGGYSSTSCAGNPVLVTHTGPASMFDATGSAGQGINNWRFRDLRYTNTGSAGLSTAFIWTTVSQSTWTLYGTMQLRIEKLGMGTCLDYFKESTSDGWLDLISNVSGHCQLTTATSGTSTWVMQYGVGSRYGGFIDNHWEVAASAGSQLFEHRIMGISHTYIGHSKMTCNGQTGGTGCTTQFRAADGAATTRSTQWNVFQDWLSIDNSAESFTYLMVQPVHGAAGLYDAGWHDLLIDRFVVKVGSGRLQSSSPIFLLEIRAPNVTIRNSILDTRGQTGTQGQFLLDAQRDGQSGNVLDPTGLNFYNNLWLRSGAPQQNGLICSNQAAASSGMRCRNNVVWDAAGSDASATAAGFTCSGCIALQNVHLLQTAGDCPFVGAADNCSLSIAGSGASVLEYALRTSGGNVTKLKDAGFAFPDVQSAASGYVFLDAAGLCRPSGAAFDIGAFEYGAGSACLRQGALAPPRLQGGSIGGGSLSDLWPTPSRVWPF